MGVVNEEHYSGPSGEGSGFFLSKPPWEWEEEQWEQFYASVLGFLLSVFWAAHIIQNILSVKAGVTTIAGTGEKKRRGV